METASYSTTGTRSGSCTASCAEAHRSDERATTERRTVMPDAHKATARTSAPIPVGPLPAPYACPSHPVFPTPLLRGERRGSNRLTHWVARVFLGLLLLSLLLCEDSPARPSLRTTAPPSIQTLPSSHFGWRPVSTATSSTEVVLDEEHGAAIRVQSRPPWTRAASHGWSRVWKSLSPVQLVSAAEATWTPSDPARSVSEGLRVPTLHQVEEAHRSMRRKSVQAALRSTWRTSSPPISLVSRDGSENSSFLSWVTTPGSTSCPASTGCPEHSMVWAEGSFTATGGHPGAAALQGRPLPVSNAEEADEEEEEEEDPLHWRWVHNHPLMPSTLATESNLTLKLSLCCGYLFKGRALLSSLELYDEMLEELLRSTPFGEWSRSEKRALFPPRKAMVFHSQRNQTYYSTHPTSDNRDRMTSVAGGAADRRASPAQNDVPNRSTLLEEESELQYYPLELEEEGDGDVLLLVTGVVPSPALQRLRAHLQSARQYPQLLLDERLTDEEEEAPGAASGETHSTEKQKENSVAAVLDSRHRYLEMHLRIATAVLRCKCPHTLLARPALRLYEDALQGTVTLKGLGAHCGSVEHLLDEMNQKKSRKEENGFPIHYLARPQLRLVQTPGQAMSQRGSASTTPSSSSASIAASFQMQYGIPRRGSSQRLQALPLPAGTQVEWSLYKVKLRHEHSTTRSSPASSSSLASSPHMMFSLPRAEEAMTSTTAEEVLIFSKTQVMPVLEEDHRRRRRASSGMEGDASHSVLLSPHSPLFASPYMVVEPHTVYRVRVRVRRPSLQEPNIPDNDGNVSALHNVQEELVREASGLFVLRVPFPDLLTLPSASSSSSPQLLLRLPPSYTEKGDGRVQDFTAVTLSATPHFGSQRTVRLSPPSQAKVSAALQLGVTGASAAGPGTTWYHYYQAYWEGSRDQKRQPAQVPSSGAVQSALGEAVWHLAPGQNAFSFFVGDADAACPPVAVEHQEVWSVQALWRGEAVRETESVVPPHAMLTACAPLVPLRGEPVREVLSAMRSTGAPLLRDLYLTGEADGLTSSSSMNFQRREGHLHCQSHPIHLVNSKAESEMISETSDPKEKGKKEAAAHQQAVQRRLARRQALLTEEKKRLYDYYVEHDDYPSSAPSEEERCVALSVEEARSRLQREPEVDAVFRQWEREDIALEEHYPADQDYFLWATEQYRQSRAQGCADCHRNGVATPNAEHRWPIRSLWDPLRGDLLVESSSPQQPTPLSTEAETSGLLLLPHHHRTALGSRPREVFETHWHVDIEVYDPAQLHPDFLDPLHAVVLLRDSEPTETSDHATKKSRGGWFSHRGAPKERSEDHTGGDAGKGRARAAGAALQWNSTRMGPRPANGPPSPQPVAVVRLLSHTLLVAPRVMPARRPFTAELPMHSRRLMVSPSTLLEALTRFTRTTTAPTLLSLDDANASSLSELGSKRDGEGQPLFVTHVWDDEETAELKVAIAGDDAGDKKTYANAPPELELSRLSGRWLFRPPLELLGFQQEPSEGRGEVHRLNLEFAKTVDTAAERGGVQKEPKRTERETEDPAVDAFLSRSAVFDTSRVPNQEGWLTYEGQHGLVQSLNEHQEGPAVLELVVSDLGYTFQDAAGDLHHAQCGSRIYPLRLRVRAHPVVPWLPSSRRVYMEESCVRVFGPRSARKDERISWESLPCPGVAAPPVLTPQTLHPQEGLEGEEGLFARPDTAAAVWCGVVPYHYCEVVWRASNPISSTHQTISLRRCEQPPLLQFHPALHYYYYYDEEQKDGKNHSSEKTAEMRNTTTSSFALRPFDEEETLATAQHKQNGTPHRTALPRFPWLTVSQPQNRFFEIQPPAFLSSTHSSIHQEEELSKKPGGGSRSFATTSQGRLLLPLAGVPSTVMNVSLSRRSSVIGYTFYRGDNHRSETHAPTALHFAVRVEEDDAEPFTTQRLFTSAHVNTSLRQRWLEASPSPIRTLLDAPRGEKGTQRKEPPSGADEEETLLASSSPPSPSSPPHCRPRRPKKLRILGKLRHENQTRSSYSYSDEEREDVEEEDEFETEETMAKGLDSCNFDLAQTPNTTSNPSLATCAGVGLEHHRQPQQPRRRVSLHLFEQLLLRRSFFFKEDLPHEQADEQHTLQETPTPHYFLTATNSYAQFLERYCWLTLPPPPFSSVPPAPATSFRTTAEDGSSALLPSSESGDAVLEQRSASALSALRWGWWCSQEWEDATSLRAFSQQLASLRTSAADRATAMREKRQTAAFRLAEESEAAPLDPSERGAGMTLASLRHRLATLEPEEREEANVLRRERNEVADPLRHHVLSEEPAAQQLRVRTAATSALFPARLLVTTSPSTTPGEGGGEEMLSCDREEEIDRSHSQSTGDSQESEEHPCIFQQLGLCKQRRQDAALLVVAPSGVVPVDPRYRVEDYLTSQEKERYTSSPSVKPLLTPIVGVIPYCAASYPFSRHPELDTLLGYEFEWTCEKQRPLGLRDEAAGGTKWKGMTEGAVEGLDGIRVERLEPTYSVLHFVPLHQSTTSQGDEKTKGKSPTLERKHKGFFGFLRRSTPLSTAEALQQRIEANPSAYVWPNHSICALTVRNRLTKTTATEHFLFLKLFPTAAPSQFEVLSDNVLRQLPPTGSRRQRGGSSNQSRRGRAANGSTVSAVRDAYADGRDEVTEEEQFFGDTHEVDRPPPTRVVLPEERETAAPRSEASQRRLTVRRLVGPQVTLQAPGVPGWASASQPTASPSSGWWSSALDFFASPTPQWEMLRFVRGHIAASKRRKWRNANEMTSNVSSVHIRSSERNDVRFAPLFYNPTSRSGVSSRDSTGSAASIGGDGSSFSALATSSSSSAAVEITGMRVPGLYVFQVRHTDAAHPGVCPAATWTETFEVFRAALDLDESSEQYETALSEAEDLDTVRVCGSVAELKAIPLPSELQSEFVGQWEIVSTETVEGVVVERSYPELLVEDTLQEKTIKTSRGEEAENEKELQRETGAQSSWDGGVWIPEPRQSHTMIQHLPFGVVTVRWVIYRRLNHTEAMTALRRRRSSSTNLFDTQAAKAAALANASGYQHWLLRVDAVPLRLLVVTENLPMPPFYRTLSDSVQLFASASALRWRVLYTHATPLAASEAIHDEEGEGKPPKRRSGEHDGTPAKKGWEEEEALAREELDEIFRYAFGTTQPAPRGRALPPSVQLRESIFFDELDEERVRQVEEEERQGTGTKPSAVPRHGKRARTLPEVGMHRKRVLARPWLDPSSPEATREALQLQEQRKNQQTQRSRLFGFASETSHWAPSTVSYTRADSRLVTLSALAIGVTALEYDLVPSPQLFDIMKQSNAHNPDRQGSLCPPLKRRVWVERMMAGLRVDTSLWHECSAYNGVGSITMCLDVLPHSSVFSRGRQTHSAPSATTASSSSSDLNFATVDAQRNDETRRAPSSGYPREPHTPAEWSQDRATARQLSGVEDENPWIDPSNALSSRRGPGRNRRIRSDDSQRRRVGGRPARPPLLTDEVAIYQRQLRTATAVGWESQLQLVENSTTLEAHIKHGARAKERGWDLNGEGDEEGKEQHHSGFPRSSTGCQTPWWTAETTRWLEVLPLVRSRPSSSETTRTPRTVGIESTLPTARCVRVRVQSSQYLSPAQLRQPLFQAIASSTLTSPAAELELNRGTEASCSTGEAFLSAHILNHTLLQRQYSMLFFYPSLPHVTPPPASKTSDAHTNGSTSTTVVEPEAEAEVFFPLDYTLQGYMRTLHFTAATRSSSSSLKDQGHRSSLPFTQRYLPIVGPLVSRDHRSTAPRTPFSSTAYTTAPPQREATEERSRSRYATTSSPSSSWKSPRYFSFPSNELLVKRGEGSELGGLSSRQTFRSRRSVSHVAPSSEAVAVPSSKGSWWSWGAQHQGGAKALTTPASPSTKQMKAYYREHASFHIPPPAKKKSFLANELEEDESDIEGTYWRDAGWGSSLSMDDDDDNGETDDEWEEEDERLVLPITSYPRWRLQQRRTGDGVMGYGGGMLPLVGMSDLEQHLSEFAISGGFESHEKEESEFHREEEEPANSASELHSGAAGESSASGAEEAEGGTTDHSLLASLTAWWRRRGAQKPQVRPSFTAREKKPIKGNGNAKEGRSEAAPERSTAPAGAVIELPLRFTSLWSSGGYYDPSSAVLGGGEPLRSLIQSETSRKQDSAPQPLLVLPPLLQKCLVHNVRGEDVLPFWSEVRQHKHRMSDDDDDDDDDDELDEPLHLATSPWKRYLAAVRRTVLPCEVRLLSLQPLIDLRRAASGASDDEKDAKKTKCRRSRQTHSSSSTRWACASSSSSAASFSVWQPPGGPTTPGRLSYVSLEEIEAELLQLEEAAETDWTWDGIEISGLSPALQEALRRRKLTKSQLAELQRQRRGLANHTAPARRSSGLLADGNKRRSFQRDPVTSGTSTSPEALQRVQLLLERYHRVLWDYIQQEEEMYEGASHRSKSEEEERGEGKAYADSSMMGATATRTTKEEDGQRGSASAASSFSIRSAEENARVYRKYYETFFEGAYHWNGAPRQDTASHHHFKDEHLATVASLRLTLPLHRPFYLSKDLHLQASLHKAIVCGLPLSEDTPASLLPPAALSFSFRDTYGADRQKEQSRGAEELVSRIREKAYAETERSFSRVTASPHAYVQFGRIVIRDEAPQWRLWPRYFKQCEMEGGLPSLRLEIRGEAFQLDQEDDSEAHGKQLLSARRVRLEEVDHPYYQYEHPPSFPRSATQQHLPQRTGEGSDDEENGYTGLRPCLGRMREGLQAHLTSQSTSPIGNFNSAARTLRRPGADDPHNPAGNERMPDPLQYLHLQLQPCPSFQMLAPEEYNEEQESAALLRRMRYPRILKVTVEGVLDRAKLKHVQGEYPSSFLSPHIETEGSQQEDLLSRQYGSHHAFKGSSVLHSVGGRVIVDPATGDVSFLVEVRPTIARLYLRSMAQQLARYPHEAIAVAKDETGHTLPQPRSGAALDRAEGVQESVAGGTGTPEADVASAAGSSERSLTTGSSTWSPRSQDDRSFGSASYPAGRLSSATVRRWFRRTVAPFHAAAQWEGSAEKTRGKDHMAGGALGESEAMAEEERVVAVNSRWGKRDVRSTKYPHSGVDEDQVLSPPPAVPLSPLLVCEGRMKASGFSLGIELLGDTWSAKVGEEDPGAVLMREHAAAVASQRSRADSPDSRDPLPRRRRRARVLRAAENVAMLNSFTVVEALPHYYVDMVNDAAGYASRGASSFYRYSYHQLYLKGGGVYRSHFLHYFFTHILGDEALLNEFRFLTRYNDTFVSLEVPPTLRPERRSREVQLLHAERSFGNYEEVDFERGGEDSTWGERKTSKQRTTSSKVSAPQLRLARVRGVRRFSKVEEILFTIPGIATLCRGCLLADTTFFVAGDWSGLWFLPARNSTTEASSSSRTIAGSGQSNAPPAGRALQTVSSYASMHPALREHYRQWRRAEAVDRKKQKQPQTKAGSEKTSRADPVKKGEASAFFPLKETHLRDPALVPWFEPSVVPQAWDYEWLCPRGAHAAARRALYGLMSGPHTTSHEAKPFTQGGLSSQSTEVQNASGSIAAQETRSSSIVSPYLKVEVVTYVNPSAWDTLERPQTTEVSSKTPGALQREAWRAQLLEATRSLLGEGDRREGESDEEGKRSPGTSVVPLLLWRSNAVPLADVVAGQATGEAETRRETDGLPFQSWEGISRTAETLRPVRFHRLGSTGTLSQESAFSGVREGSAPPPNETHSSPNEPHRVWWEAQEAAELFLREESRRVRAALRAERERVVAAAPPPLSVVSPSTPGAPPFYPSEWCGAQPCAFRSAAVPFTVLHHEPLVPPTSLFTADNATDTIKTTTLPHRLDASPSLSTHHPYVVTPAAAERHGLSLGLTEDPSSGAPSQGVSLAVNASIHVSLCRPPAEEAAGDPAVAESSRCVVVAISEALLLLDRPPPPPSTSTLRSPHHKQEQTASVPFAAVLLQHGWLPLLGHVFQLGSLVGLWGDALQSAFPSTAWLRGPSLPWVGWGLWLMLLVGCYGLLVQPAQPPNAPTTSWLSFLLGPGGVWLTAWLGLWVLILLRGTPNALRVIGFVTSAVVCRYLIVMT